MPIHGSVARSSGVDRPITLNKDFVNVARDETTILLLSVFVGEYQVFATDKQYLSILLHDNYFHKCFSTLKVYLNKFRT